MAKRNDDTIPGRRQGEQERDGTTTTTNGVAGRQCSGREEIDSDIENPFQGLLRQLEDLLRAQEALQAMLAAKNGSEADTSKDTDASTYFESEGGPKLPISKSKNARKGDQQDRQAKPSGQADPLQRVVDLAAELHEAMKDVPSDLRRVWWAIAEGWIRKLADEPTTEKSEVAMPCSRQKNSSDDPESE